MTRNSNSDFLSKSFFDLFAYLIRYRRIRILCQFLLEFFLWECRIFFRYRTLSNCED